MEERITMKSKNVVLGCLLAGALVFGGFALAQGPVVNINPQRHSNLADAQHHLQQACGKIDEAQKENKDELGGHAAKAKDLIDAADRELKAAAEFADHRK
jgi:F0F1-type ATP synthase membrane subunit b/b'